MTPPELDERARSCLRAAVSAWESHDGSHLEGAGFTPLMRRALERLIERTPPGGAFGVNDVDWNSHTLAETKRFSDLHARLHEFIAAGKPMVQLTALDRQGAVCDFAFLEDVTKAASRWYNVATFSMHYKLDALLLGGEGFTFSTRRLGDNMNAIVSLSREQVAALSGEDLDGLLETLIGIASNAQRLMWAAIRPKTIHVIIAKAADEPGRSLSGLRPPIDRWLADRMVKIPD